MLDMVWEEFWWNNITGAHVVVSKVANALLENSIIVLSVPSDLPWRHSMRSSIHSAFQEKNNSRDVVIEPIDIVDDNPERIEAGKFILQRYAPSAVCRGYREKSKVSIQEYITQKEVIKNRIIWVKGLTEKTAEEWIKFCKGFSPKSVEDGLFVLEVHGKVSMSELKNLRYIDFAECVSSYDVQVFNSFILDAQNQYADMWKKYISTVAALVCEVDAEVSEILLRLVDFKSETAIEGIKRISEFPDFARRGAERDSKHVLWYYRNNKIAELEHRIWSAQVQILFPIIELERVRIINDWEETIRTVLKNNSVLQYGEVITEPMDVELGTLCYMLGHRVSNDLYMLYIPDEAERNRIRFLHDCRNSLAHVSCCSPTQVLELLG